VFQCDFWGIVCIESKWTTFDPPLLYSEFEHNMRVKFTYT